MIEPLKRFLESSLSELVSEAPIMAAYKMNIIEMTRNVRSMLSHPCENELEAAEVIAKITEVQICLLVDLIGWLVGYMHRIENHPMDIAVGNYVPEQCDLTNQVLARLGAELEKIYEQCGLSREVVTTPYIPE